MTPTNVNEIRQELQAVAVELAKQKEVIDRRDELIELARSQTPPMTLREVAQLLKMTERGVDESPQLLPRTSPVVGLLIPRMPPARVKNACNFQYFLPNITSMTDREEA